MDRGFGWLWWAFGLWRGGRVCGNIEGTRGGSTVSSEPLPARPLYMYLLKGVGSSFFFLCVVCASFQCRVNRSC